MLHEERLLLSIWKLKLLLIKHAVLGEPTSRLFQTFRFSAAEVE